MKEMLSLPLTIFLLFTLSSMSKAENRFENVEIKVGKNDILTFSSHGLKAKLCSECLETDLITPNTTDYYEQNKKIPFDKATELYVRKTYDFVSVFYNRKTNMVSTLVFGGFNELATDEATLEKGDKK